MTDKIVRGRDNAHWDYDVSDADVLQARATLAARIVNALDKRKLGVNATGRLIGVDPADLSRIRTGNLSRFTIDRLMRIAARLDRTMGVRVVFARRAPCPPARSRS